MNDRQSCQSECGAITMAESKSCYKVSIMSFILHHERSIIIIRICSVRSSPSVEEESSTVSSSTQMPGSACLRWGAGDAMTGWSTRTGHCSAPRVSASTRSRLTRGGDTCSGTAPTVCASVMNHRSRVTDTGHCSQPRLTPQTTW